MFGAESFSRTLGMLFGRLPDLAPVFCTCTLPANQFHHKNKSTSLLAPFTQRSRSFLDQLPGEANSNFGMPNFGLKIFNYSYLSFRVINNISYAFTTYILRSYWEISIIFIDICSQSFSDSCVLFLFDKFHIPSPKWYYFSPVVVSMAY